MQHASNQSVLQWSLKRLAMRPPAPPSTAPKLSRASRILVVRLDEIGDLVVTTPFMRALRNSARRAWITLIVREASAGLLMPSGLADEIISYPSGQSYRSARGRIGDIEQLIQDRFGDQPYDYAFLPRWDTNNSDAPFICAASRATRRIWYSESVNPTKAIVNRGYDQLFTDSSKRSVVGEHEVLRNLGLLVQLGHGDQPVEIGAGPDHQ